MVSCASGFCDAECNNYKCDFDGSDCLGYLPSSPLGPVTSPAPADPAACGPNCPLHWLSNGICDEGCNVASCGYDNEDCGNRTMSVPVSQGVVDECNNITNNILPNYLNKGVGVDAYCEVTAREVGTAFTPFGPLCPGLAGPLMRLKGETTCLGWNASQADLCSRLTACVSGGAELPVSTSIGADFQFRQHANLRMGSLSLLDRARQAINNNPSIHTLGADIYVEGAGSFPAQQVVRGLMASSNLLMGVIAGDGRSAYLEEAAASLGYQPDTIQTIGNCISSLGANLTSGGTFTCAYLETVWEPKFNGYDSKDGHYMCTAPPLATIINMISEPCSSACRPLGSLPSSYPDFASIERSRECPLYRSLLLSTYSAYGGKCARTFDAQSVATLANGQAPTHKGLSGGAIVGLLLCIIVGLGLLGAAVSHMNKSAMPIEHKTRLQADGGGLAQVRVDMASSELPSGPAGTLEIHGNSGKVETANAF